MNDKETPARPQSAEPDKRFVEYLAALDKSYPGALYAAIAKEGYEMGRSCAASKLVRLQADLLTAQATVAQWCIKHLEDEEAMGKLRAERDSLRTALEHIRSFAADRRFDLNVDSIWEACDAALAALPDPLKGEAR